MCENEEEEIEGKRKEEKKERKKKKISHWWATNGEENPITHKITKCKNDYRESSICMYVCVGVYKT